VISLWLAPSAPAVAGGPWVLGCVACLLFLLTTVACLSPVRRALRVDPVASLRAE
jgi:ABC-type lipoprotein release transport system permease subunit